MPVFPRTRHMVLCRAVATSHDSATARVAQRAFLGTFICERMRMLQSEMSTYVHPSILRNSADTFDEAQSRRVRESDFRDENRTENVHPCLAFCRLACTQECIGWWVSRLALRIPSYTRAEETVGYLYPISMASCQSPRSHAPKKLLNSSHSHRARKSRTRKWPRLR